MAAAALIALVGASWLFWLLAIGAARRVLAPRAPALVTRDAPPVSVLKPVCGLDFEAWESFASHCRQRYPTYEILFGVADARDPVIPVIRQLQARYGENRVRLVIAPGEAPNPKVGLLERLAREARHDVLVAIDSDIRLAPDFLARVVGRLSEPGVGLVTLPYRGERVIGVAAALEALGIETACVPSAIVGQRVFGAQVAHGAANALTPATLDRIGGFRAIADRLADDHGEAVVGSVIGATTLSQWWRREVRRARAARASRPAQYPGLLVTLSTPLAALAAGLGAGAWLLVGSLAVRWAVGWQLTARTRHRALRRWLWLLPVRDVLAAAIWLAGLVGRRVHWRGRAFRLERDGRLVAAAPRGGIFEFSDDPRCILRLSIARGALGEPIGELHLWNEPQPACAGIGWGCVLRSRLAHSLELLAQSVARDTALEDLHAFEAEVSLGAGYALPRLDTFARRFGFRVAPRPSRLRDHLHARPIRGALPGPAEHGGKLQRVRFTITRRELLARHVAADGDAPRA